MKLNHLELEVRDVPSSVAFFQRYFAMELCSNPSSAALAILEDDSGFLLVLQRLEGDARHYPEGFHLGFLVEDVECVRRLHARAKADGAAVSEIIVNGRGTMIYFDTPEGYQVEVSYRRSARRFRDTTPGVELGPESA